MPASLTSASLVAELAYDPVALGLARMIVVAQHGSLCADMREQLGRHPTIFGGESARRVAQGVSGSRAKDRRGCRSGLRRCADRGLEVHGVKTAINLFQFNRKSHRLPIHRQAGERIDDYIGRVGDHFDRPSGCDQCAARGIWVCLQGGARKGGQRKGQWRRIEAYLRNACGVSDGSFKAAVIEIRMKNSVRGKPRASECRGDDRGLPSQAASNAINM